jgi:hypothetical protein
MSHIFTYIWETSTIDVCRLVLRRMVGFREATPSYRIKHAQERHRRHFRLVSAFGLFEISFLYRIASARAALISWLCIQDYAIRVNPVLLGCSVSGSFMRYDKP